MNAWKKHYGAKDIELETLRKLLKVYWTCFLKEQYNRLLNTVVALPLITFSMEVMKKYKLTIFF